MPTIEIHGMRGLTDEQVASYEERVKLCIQDAACADDIVTPVVYDKVPDLKGRLRPFLRIISTQDSLDEYLDEIMWQLEPLKMDIEVAPALREFCENGKRNPKKMKVSFALLKTNLPGVYDDADTREFLARMSRDPIIPQEDRGTLAAFQRRHVVARLQSVHNYNPAWATRLNALIDAVLAHYKIMRFE